MDKYVKILCLATAVWTSIAQAGTVAVQANMRNVLPGGRASMMGGAYTALSGDPSGAYYNPGGLGFLTEKSFDVSANAYRKQSITYKNAVNNEAIQQQSTNIYPSFLGVASRWGALTLGYSFVSLDQRSIYQQNKFDEISTSPYGISTYEQTHQEENTHVLAGGTAAVQLGKHWAFGTSMYYYQRTINATTVQLSTYNDGRLWSTTHTYQTLNTGVTPIFGLKASYGILDWGFSITMPRSITDNTDIITSQVIYDPTLSDDDAPITSREASEFTQLNEVNPITYRTGIALRPATWFTFAADAIAHEGKKNKHVAGTKHDFITTWDFSTGFELGGPSGALRAGYFTNNSLFRELSQDDVNQPSHIDYTGYSFGFGWRLGDFQGELGVIEQTGTGQAQSIADSTSIQEVAATNTVYSVSGNLPIK